MQKFFKWKQVIREKTNDFHELGYVKYNYTILREYITKF